MKNTHKAFKILAITLCLTACGGGSSSTTHQSTTKTATICFNIISTAQLTAPVQGVQLSVYLPAGVVVGTDSNGTTLSSTALGSGSGITSPDRQLFGSYSAGIRKVKISVVTTEDTFRGGEFARLTVSYPSATTLTANDFTGVNSPSFSFFEAGGYVAGSGSVDLTGKLRASLGVVFN